MSPDALFVLLRALGFVAMLQAAGIAMFVALFAQHLEGARDDIRRLGRWSAAAALPLLLAQLILEPARMAGEFGGVLDLQLQRVALASPAATACGAGVLGLVLIMAALSSSARRTRLLAPCGGLLVAGSFAIVGHTAVHPYRWLLAPAVITHVLVAAFWVGALPALYLVTRRAAADPAGRVIERFSGIAIWIVPLLAAAGALMALILVPRLAVFSQPYGYLLLAKIAGFALLMGLAAANRWRLGPAVARGATRAFKRSLIAEYVLLVAVLTATATLTSLFSPEP